MIKDAIATPYIPVSWGELIDKITILEIKSTRLPDQIATANVLEELSMLMAIADAVIQHDPVIAVLKAELHAVNLALWAVEDRIREKELQQAFDAEFIGLARSVYFQNDRRAMLKKQMNMALKSQLVEEKSYRKYS
ncbi:MAG: DUF6165 family protein [Hyphomicrobiales bacterium]